VLSFAICHQYHFGDGPITLNRLCVASYPGGGRHRVLLHFCAQNQLPKRAEPVHFNATYHVQEGENAGIQGHPIFVGLNVGHEGLTLKCRTINVHNDQDETLLSFMESETFKAVLRIISTAQPVMAPFSEMALGLARALATRNRNHTVQDFTLGLDFSSILLAFSYIVRQTYNLENTFVPLLEPESEAHHD